MARRVFNSPAYVKPCVVDVAHKLLGSDNWVFLDGKAHIDYRKGLNGLFTRKALQSYLPGQEEVYYDYFKRFLQVTKDAGDKPVPFMHEFRELMCAVSLRTFCGHHVSDETVKKIADDYYLITAALELVNFPIIIPFTKAWYGKKASDMVMVEFSKASAQSKQRMEAGEEPSCIMDAWIRNMVLSKKWREAEATGDFTDTEGLEKPSPLLREFTDYEIAQTIFTFLFASQDATSSASIWLFQTVAQRPEILDRVREENLKVRQGDIHAAVDLGAMVVPTTYLALRDPDVYENPDEFDPERYYTGDAEVKGAKNFLVFGTGPHVCIGQHYAQLNLALLLGKASLLLDWTHHPTPLSEEIKVFATIFPKDDCPLTFTERI
ncbi:hypothetical protein INS49_010382 [Diaporthe citri]|uniref:uncharacterized protein n=1 Tax=Diaporthe citri TaxID=83186 RepID=UPI001C7F5E6F|nr:uncharacterized protein INS49_010382 [Diaporthe citri]KAG6362153.1 hypothetical protein INS49_010382 [Diaporthe citri]